MGGLLANVPAGTAAQKLSDTLKVSDSFVRNFRRRVGARFPRPCLRGRGDPAPTCARFDKLNERRCDKLNERGRPYADELNEEALDVLEYQMPL